MKKRTELLILSILLLLVFAGCTNHKQDAALSESPPAISSSVASAEVSQEERETVGTPQSTAPIKAPKEESTLSDLLPSTTSSSSVDIDLTAMSSTMVFAEVSNIMWEPEQYVGKIFKIRGEYTSIYYEDTGEDYHAVVIADALACCAQGLDFVWTGEHAYPADYPEEGTEIEIAGVFQMVQEGEYYYIYIETDEIIII